MAEQLILHLRERYHLIIAEITAQQAIRDCTMSMVVEVCGRDAVSGLPAKVKLSAQEIRNAISRRS